MADADHDRAVRLVEVIDANRGGGPAFAHARDQLLAMGDAAVEPLVAFLRANATDSTAGVLLRTLGPASFEPLADLLRDAGDDEALAQRAGWAFCAIEGDVIPRYIAALEDRSDLVRANAALGLQYAATRLTGSERSAAVAGLVMLIDDPDAEVRQRGEWALEELGESAVDALLALRRNGTIRQRRSARRALLGVLQPERLDPRDQQAIRRLIEWKLRGDHPRPFFDASWLAIRSTDQIAVLEALELSDPTPATWTMGLDAVLCDYWHFSKGRVEHQAPLTRVFVTPVVNGWTLVIGGATARSTDDSVQPELTCRLSSRFGEAQAYTSQGRMDWAEFTIARDGHLLRHVSKGDDDVASVGEELACESSFETLRLVDDTGNTYYEELMIDPYKVAAAHSIDPTALGRDTPQVGRGVLAATAYGREHGLPIRALRISEPESD